jgi:hypothetical protein
MGGAAVITPTTSWWLIGCSQSESEPMQTFSRQPAAHTASWKGVKKIIHNLEIRQKDHCVSFQSHPGIVVFISISIT